MNSAAVPSIDVLLPVYAQADRLLLGRAVASVYAQELPAQNLWLLINGGTEHERRQLARHVSSLAVVGHPTQLQVVEVQPAGITPALNRGLALSSADWLARLDADDRMAPGRLSRMAAHLQHCQQTGCPVPDVLGSALAVLDQSGQHPTGEVLRRPCSDRAIRRYLCIGNPLLHPSVMLRRSLLLRVGGYRSSPGTEDLDLWLRLARLRGVVLANLSEPLTLYAMRPGSLSHQRDSFLRSALCRLRHCDTPQRVLLFAPKVVSDLLRYLLAVLRG
ncbi:MAG: glycosyltransferase [Cyanobacteriota bacterium]|nr:glycosyltransferase [Cyanobacteriota bacterium]